MRHAPPNQPVKDRGLIVLMALHCVMWSVLWAVKGNDIYAALTGFAVASFVFMASWSVIQR